MNTTTTTLTPAQLRAAKENAYLRRAEAKRLGCSNVNMLHDADGLAADLLGSQAELAFRVMRGSSEAIPLNDGKLPDVDGWQVRATRYTGGTLTVRSRDAASDRYVLLVGQDEQWRVVGWVPGFYAKQNRFLTCNAPGRPPAYEVPQAHLIDYADSETAIAEARCLIAGVRAAGGEWVRDPATGVWDCTADAPDELLLRVIRRGTALVSLLLERDMK